MKDQKNLIKAQEAIKPITAEELARIDAVTPPWVPETNPRRKMIISELPADHKSEVIMKEPSIIKTITYEEACKNLKGMSIEEGARIDAETPLWVEQTNPRRLAMRIALPPKGWKPNDEKKD